MDEFNFYIRILDIENNLNDLNELKNLSSNNSIIKFSPTLIHTIENALVVAIYSLSEQMLKNKIYNILDVHFDENEQDLKDKFIFDRMPDNYAMTPNVDRIEKELKVYYRGFKLYLPKINIKYKEAYNDLVKARHSFAHANIHTEDIDFKKAIEFVKYLHSEYEDFNFKYYVDALKEIHKELINLNFENLKTYSSFRRRIEAIDFEKLKDKKRQFETNGVRSYQINGDNKIYDIYDIDYLNNIVGSIDNCISLVGSVDEKDFEVTILDIRKSLKFFDE